MHLSSLWADTRGMILPYVTLMLVVIVGVAVLALDGARYMSLQTQLQSGADALALAGAAELDRLPDSETRAIRAINTLLANRTLFGSRANVEVSRVTFYTQLPASDARPMREAMAATSPTNARFVSVTVRPVSLRTILPASFFGGANAVSAGASAVAGFDQVVCQIPPVFVCNPYETQGMDYQEATEALFQAVASPAIRRRLIRFRQRDNSSEPYDAGDFGFLDAPTLPADPDAMIESLGHARPPACFVQNGVTFRPTLPPLEISEGINVRFDLYEGRMSGHKNDPDFRPSVNVRKGYVGGGGGDGEGGSCGAHPGIFWPMGDGRNSATGLLLDREWPYLQGRMGSGRWDFSTYWQVNHGGDGRDPPFVNGAPASNSNLPSRYEVYRYEIDQDYVGDHSPGGETGVPACYGGGSLSDARDRRVLEAAIINCQSLGLKGAAQADVPVAAFGKFFLTLPQQGAQTDFMAEFVGLVRPREAVNFDMVQLYR